MNVMSAASKDNQIKKGTDYSLLKTQVCHNCYSKLSSLTHLHAHLFNVATTCSTTPTLREGGDP